MLGLNGVRSNCWLTATAGADRDVITVGSLQLLVEGDGRCIPGCEPHVGSFQLLVEGDGRCGPGCGVRGGDGIK
jgi:hypothetical protein